MEQWIDGNIFDGISSQSEQAREYAARWYPRQICIRTDLERLWKKGYRNIYFSQNERILESLEKTNFSLHFAGPHLNKLIREATVDGPVAAGLRRISSLGGVNALRLAWSGVLRTPKLVRKDFASIIGLLLESEVLQLPRKPDNVLLNHILADMYVLNQNADSLFSVIQFIRDDLRCKAGVVTHNPARLIELTKDNGVHLDIIAAPYTSDFSTNAFKVALYAPRQKVDSLVGFDAAAVEEIPGLPASVQKKSGGIRDENDMA